MKKLALKLGTMITVFMPSIALAQKTPPTPVTKKKELIELMESIRDWFYTIFLVVAVIFLIMAAFKYLTASGDSEKIKQAKNALIYAIVAIAIAILAGGITTLVGSLLGAPANQTTF